MTQDLIYTVKLHFRVSHEKNVKKKSAFLKEHSFS